MKGSTYCDVIVRRAPGTTISCAFGFEATGLRPAGIYRVARGSTTRHGSTFGGWLRAVVELGGGVADGP